MAELAIGAGNQVGLVVGGGDQVGLAIGMEAEMKLVIGVMPGALVAGDLVVAGGDLIVAGTGIQGLRNHTSSTCC